ncbi:MAG: anaerobic ribonucleoside-triphosphate reductase activating protein [Candidatus Gracilibacteria bacterium]|nr:anaerobic ribonucleoside-triphosphate reductase activating protein [Candidatus Gracilibacteria bacterium]
MLISGIKTTTLLDYPGKVAAIIYTLGCNFRCGFCHNPEFVLPDEVRKQKDDVISEEAFFRFLETRKNFLEGVVICGGEPTIHQDLPEFASKIKNLGYLVKLDTNGSHPRMLQTMLVQQLVDYVAMDIKAPIERYTSLVGVSHDTNAYRESIRLLLTSDIDYEFRSTVIQGWHTEVDIREMAQDIAGAKKYFLQNYRPNQTLDPNFSGSSFTSEELIQLRDIAALHVANCRIRL